MHFPFPLAIEMVTAVELASKSQQLWLTSEDGCHGSVTGVVYIFFYLGLARYIGIINC